MPRARATEQHETVIATGDEDRTDAAKRPVPARVATVPPLESEHTEMKKLVVL